MAKTSVYTTEESELSRLRLRVAALENELVLSLEESSAILDSRSSTDVPAKLIALAQRFLPADAYAVWRRRDGDGVWMLAASAGLSKKYMEDGAISSSGHAELPRELMVFEDVRHAPLLEARLPSLRAEGIRSMLALPIRIAERGKGTLVFYWRSPHQFTTTETRTAKAFESLAAAALANSDLIERHSAELDVVTDGVPALISYVDPQQRFRRVNHAYEKLFGLKREEILGKTVAEIVGPEHYEIAKPYLEKALRGEPANFRSRVRGHDGTLRDIELSCRPDIGIDETVRGVVVMAQDTTDQNQAQLARARLAAIVDSSDDAIISKTLDGEITSWNAAAQAIFGYTSAEAVGRRITMIIPEERRAEEDEVLARLRRGEKIEHFETERRTKDGRTINISLTISPVKDSEGNIIGASKTARDITEKKRREERLFASERYLQTVLNSMPEGVTVLGPDGTVLQMNGAGLRMFEADAPGQMQGRSLYPIIGGKGREAFRSLNESIFRGGPGGTTEFCITGQTGAERTFETNIVPLLGIEEKPVGALSVIRDITERKHAEAERLALLAREGMARQTAELLNRVGPILSAELDPQKLAQKVTDLVTEAVRAEFGALFHNLLNEHGESYLLYTLSGVPREAFEKFPLPRNTLVFGPTFRGEGVVRSDDITADPRYGKNTPYRGMPEGHLPVRSYLAVPIVARTGTVLGGLFFGHSRTGVFTEEQERIATGIAAQAAIALDNAALFADSQRSQQALRRSNEELKRANEDLYQFAHSASHDLQEPLRTISIYSQLLRRKVEATLDEEGTEYITNVLKGASRMEALIRDLLAYSQASALSDEQAPVSDSNTALSSALANLKAAIESSAAVIERADLPLVRIPAVHLAQLFQNLVGNALKYRRKAPPRIRILARQHESGWLFIVEDNGIGIEEKYKEQIFGIFKRLHSADEYSGTGVGLAICQRLVERAGGRIWVESQPGRGSTFFFTLPAEA